ncbi:ubiquitinyl hydrolase 1 [Malassezia cuniculi]|uniref:Ubiquitin carboxyl-terminal hydrolase n=1 Tax=Malassezia cuniculi TaxID=948313 RepID=A0AAF0J8B0_9BASI|nr:ubiquitinyl hydrolase 1 [Malassezia cuniculi]
MAKMTTAVPVKVKHNGKTYDITIDASLDGRSFKDAIYTATGVPPERQKVMTKGGLLKDDTPLERLGAHAGQLFMVVGTAGALPAQPVQPVKFLEDMPDADVAQAADVRAGLVNLGNTCYLNSTLQVLRMIPELGAALKESPARIGTSGDAGLVAALRDLYRDLGNTTEAVPPIVFLTVLRQLAPQFAERGEGGGYAQQDAEEVYVRIVNSLSSLSAPGADGRLTEQYMTGTMSTERRNIEAADEAPTSGSEPFLMLHCNISSATNEMTAGILDALEQRVEKHSEMLGRTAIHSEKSRVSRLPKYLSVHFVRFFWRRDINRKTKIMRKVKFPFELDARAFATPELAAQLDPAAGMLRDLEKARDERRRVRRRNPKSDEEADAEEARVRSEEDAQLNECVSPAVRADTGSNHTGLYDLVGIVTHKGADADAGHYMGWTRREDADAPGGLSDSWYRFDDDRVTIVEKDKIEGLSGGGEDSVAYILLYRAKEL